MKESPFIFGKTVSHGAFTNREDEIERLSNNLISGINTMIISPRRWGKTSLVEKVSLNLKSKYPELKIVNVDIFSANSAREFLENFAQNIIKSSSTVVEDWVRTGREFFRNIIPRLSFGTDPITDFSISFDFGDSNLEIDEILNLAEAIATRKKIKFIINIDEFQNVVNFKDYPNLENKLRAVWQKQKNVTYCIFGSKRHLMEDIFTNSSKPFYKFGDVIFLQKIRREKWVDFITSRFKETGKNISETNAGLIADLLQNHPWYVQQLSHICWSKTSKILSNDLIIKSLDEVINSNNPLFQREIDILSRTQLNLLKAVAVNETQLTSVDVIKRYNLGTPSNVLKNKSVLVKNDIFYDNSGKLDFSDPVFLLWFKRDYLKQLNFSPTGIIPTGEK